MRTLLHALLTVIALFTYSTSFAKESDATSSLTLCCRADHELYNLLRENNVSCNRSDSFREAVDSATPDSGVLLLADDYPTTRAHVEPSALEIARAKNLRLYLEFPDSLPGTTFDPVLTTTVERMIVSTSTLSSALPHLSLATISGCHYIATTSSRTLLSIGRVAGYDKAIYGIPPTARPILFELPELNALVATTGLSRFISGRYAPAATWKAVWEAILSRVAGKSITGLQWKPAVRPAYARESSLPSDYEVAALRAAAQWITNSRLLLPDERVEDIHKLLPTGAADVALPPPSTQPGDGTNGILEGYTSNIGHDGTQRQVIPLRADCQAESAMLLAINSAVDGNTQHSKVARNLLNYTFGENGFVRGVRADPKHGAYGLIAWGIIAPAWEIGNYGDDNARVILATLASASLLKETSWDTAILRAIAANFRTTGRQGFRNDRVDVPELEKHGWKYFNDRDIVNLSPHFEAWLWSCYLLAYQQTQYEPFLAKTRTAIHKMMEAYPAGWRWQDNSERTDMLLTLAWLVRVDDTPQHRKWMHQVAADLLKHVDSSGAIPEILAGSGGGHYQVPQSNESFGVGESPILQQNGDPVTDQLYTTAFAFIALHEAAAVTSDTAIRTAEDKLAEYLCRIQVESERHPYLDGAWLRAFDYKLWDYWASSGDIGWGPWCAEAGWGHTWIGTTLGLRERKQTLWDLINGRKWTNAWPAIEKEMLSEMKP